jgi:glycerol uptake facilitator-like aquaporin
MADLARRAVAEGLGTALLVTAIIGSGIMADRLSGDQGVTLLANSLATGAALVALLTILGPISGAHLNPAVTFVLALRGAIRAREAAVYVAVQVAGGLAGAVLAHLMFELPLVAIAAQVRTGQGQWLAEFVATFGLVFVVLSGLRVKPEAVPVLVGLYIVSAYWFTASTSFANPAVTIARALTDTFTGIRPMDVPLFLVAQLLAALAGAALATWLAGGSAVRR